MYRLTVAFLMLSCAGCGLGIQQRIGSLEKEHARQEQRLAVVRADVAASEARARQARERARFEECRALHASVDAEVLVRESQCFSEVAQFNRCESRQSERSARVSWVGCTLSIAAVALTSGAATGWALGGCGLSLGAGEMSKSECELPSCTGDHDTLRTRVIQDRGVNQLPPCGGYLGVTLSPQWAVHPAGIVVERVGAMTTAHQMGIRQGDILVSISGYLMSTMSIEKALSHFEEGEKIIAFVVRGDQTLELEAPLTKVNADGEKGRTLQLGIYNAGRVENVEYVRAAMVEYVEPGSPAAVAGMQAGDNVLAINKQVAIGGVALVERMFARLPAGSRAHMILERGERRFDVTVVLAPRGERLGL